MADTTMWIKRVAAWRASGQTAAEYCERHGLGLSALRYTLAGNHPLAFGDPSGLARQERADLERKGWLATRGLRSMLNTWGPEGQGYGWEEFGESAADTTVGSFAIRNKNRGFGALRVAGGYGIASLGAGLAVLPGGQVVGGVLVAVGVDQMAAGAIEVISNRPQESYLHRGARAVGGKVFADDFEMAATVAAPTGAAAGMSRVSLSAAGVIRRSSSETERALEIVDGQYETYYRSMSRTDVQSFAETGRVPATTETFISPSKGFSTSYSGVLVEFQLENGTTSELRNIGVRAHGQRAAALFPDLPPVKRGWGRSQALFKTEGPQVNIGLGTGKALDLFNERIRGFLIHGTN